MQFGWVFSILLAWSALWAGLSVWRGRSVVQGGFLDGFWMMSGLWAALNVAIVAYGIARPVPSAEEFAATLRLNAWLDFGYGLCGLALLRSSRRFLRGFGVAILVQAGFLAVLDFGGAMALGGK